MELPCLDYSESSSDQPSGQEPQQGGPNVRLADITPAALVLPSSGDSELNSDSDAQVKSGYEASPDAVVHLAHLANMYHLT